MSNAMMAAAALAVLAAAAALPAAAASDDPLVRHVWRDRVLVALAPTATDRNLIRQKQIFTAMGSGAHERDLVLVEAVDGTPDGVILRRRFGGTGFRSVLIGKDGGEKLTADHPLGPDVLFRLIDSMPMRQEEMRRQ